MIARDRVIAVIGKIKRARFEEAALFFFLPVTSQVEIYLSVLLVTWSNNPAAFTTTMGDSQFQPTISPPSLSEDAKRKVKEIRPFRVFLGFLGGIVLAFMPGIGWAGLIIFLIISFREDRSLFIGILIALSLVLLLVAACFTLLDWR